MGGDSGKVEVAKLLGGCGQCGWGGRSLGKHTHDPSAGQAEPGGLPLVFGQAVLQRETDSKSYSCQSSELCVVDIDLLLGAYRRF